MEETQVKSLADQFLQQAYDMLAEAETPEKKHEAILKLCEALFVMEPAKQALTIDHVAAKFKITKKIIKDQLKAFGNGEAQLARDMIDDEKVDEIETFGFYEDGNVYKFLTKDGAINGSNFVIKPLFHIYSKSDNKRLIEIINERGSSRIVDIPSKNFVSLDQFQQLMYNEGNYLFFGNKSQFFKILNKISEEFPICNELKTLGWQREGFFAFANGIYSNGHYQPINKFGITQHGENKYFSPAFSVVYTDVREDDDDYENDRFFIYHQSPIDFTEWCRHMETVYSEKAMWGIAFLLSALFRDVIYDKFKFFPHLFLFGQPQSGKSALSWSLSNVFFSNLPAFNLNSGTNVGFFRRLARFRNTIAWFDEFTNEIDLKRFQALKAAYDGIGHEKGKMTRDNRTEITKINAASVISGQYKPTADDNALFTRSILLSFPRRDADNPFTKEDAQNLDKLRSYEKQGLSGMLTELLQYRDVIEKEYPMSFTEVYNAVKGHFINLNKNYTERIIMNFVAILTTIKVFESKTPIRFGFTYKDIYEDALKLIESQSKQISDSDALASFWNTIQFLWETNHLTAGTDFKISSHTSIKVYDGRSEIGIKTFQKPTKLLFIRFTKIHPLYLEAHRKQHGTTGIDLTSLKYYISNSNAYVGSVNAVKFEGGTNTSAYVFDYDKLKVNLGSNMNNDEDLPF